MLAQVGEKQSLFEAAHLAAQMRIAGALIATPKSSNEPRNGNMQLAVEEAPKEESGSQQTGALGCESPARAGILASQCGFSGRILASLSASQPDRRVIDWSKLIDDDKRPALPDHAFECA